VVIADARRFFALVTLVGAIVAQSSASVADPVSPPQLTIERGIDRSNMSTEWTLAPPAEPNVYPFNGFYNGAGVFEARRVAIFDGIGRMHPQWFRDGFGGDTTQDAELFADTVTQVHARGTKMLAVVGPTSTDFDPKDRIPGNPGINGCQWSTAPLSKMNLAKLEHRIRTHFDVLQHAGLVVDAFEIGNELDLYCNDADMPLTADFAKHNWKWFLTPAQVHRFAAGYVPFLTTFVRLIREYFPHAKIITFGMSNPTGNSAPLIAALANFADSAGRTFDYTQLVDGYGTHFYPHTKTTRDLVSSITTELTGQAALLPHQSQKPIWITEWNEAGSALWSSDTWYFRYYANGTPGGNLDIAAAPYRAMSRAQTIRIFNTVIASLRIQPNPVNIGYSLYYSYDSAAASAMCNATEFDRSRGIVGTCYSGVIDPISGELLPDVAAAVMDRTVNNPLR
jgi:hypothetical protein